jgi:hypothetical protein
LVATGELERAGRGQRRTVKVKRAKGEVAQR